MADSQTKDPNMASASCDQVIDDDRTFQHASSRSQIGKGVFSLTHDETKHIGE